MMMHRLLTGDDNTQSLIAYARTLASTYTITEKSISDLQTIDIASTLSTVYFALYMHMSMQFKIGPLIKMLEYVGNNDIIPKIIASLIPTLLKLFEVFGETAQSYIETFTNNTETPSIKTIITYNSYTALINKLKVQINDYEPKYRQLTLYKGKLPEHITLDDNDDDSDDNDNDNDKIDENLSEKEFGNDQDNNNESNSNDSNHYDDNNSDNETNSTSSLSDDGRFHVNDGDVQENIEKDDFVEWFKTNQYDNSNDKTNNNIT
jgi:hypothetical protein